MKNNNQNTEEFYVGYLPNAPAGISKRIKVVSIMIGIVVLTVATFIGLNQRQFSSATFEYGTTTTIEGILYTTPVPHLKVSFGKNSEGQEIHQNVILVGSGKFGAENVLQRIEDKVSIKLHRKIIRISGYLIYGDGKALLQVNADSNIDVLAEARQDESINIKSRGFISVNGEVIDPKCYFGVMKPGEGKTHRACAIRCIAGGIPPVFKSGMSDYFLLTDENFAPVNQQVLDLVGDDIRLNGELLEIDDWKILKVKIEDLKKMSSAATLKRNIQVIDDGVTLCMN